MACNAGAIDRFLGPEGANEGQMRTAHASPALHSRTNVITERIRREYIVNDGNVIFTHAALQLLFGK